MPEKFAGGGKRWGGGLFENINFHVQLSLPISYLFSFLCKDKTSKVDTEVTHDLRFCY